MAPTGATSRATATLAAVALASGACLGSTAALADAAGGALGTALSLPGLWIAGGVLVAALTGRAGVRATGERARSTAFSGALSTAAFLVAGMVAYYVGKQLLTGAVPGPLVVFWLAVATAVGLVGGALCARLAMQPWGSAALAAGVCGWLLAEAFTAPSAPWAEAVLAVVIAATVAGLSRRPGVAPWALGTALGAAGAVLVLGVLPSLLTSAL